MKVLLFASIAVAWVLIGCGGVHTPQNQTSSAEIYHNAEYDLTICLPADWKGYSVILEHWNNTNAPNTGGEPMEEHGPMIILRNPQWKAIAPCQDIPIMVFTRDQWKHDSGEALSMYAGGAEAEISHNSKYVFAIYSRYDADDSVKGWDEAARIVQQNQEASPHLDFP